MDGVGEVFNEGGFGLERLLDFVVKFLEELWVDVLGLYDLIESFNLGLVFVFFLL